MSVRAGLPLVLALAMSALVASASAQPPSVQTDEKGEAPTPDAAVTDAALTKEQDAGPEAEARRLYAEGKAAYAQGRFMEAIALFERAYTLSAAPALLFNMAQAHRLAGAEHCPEALTLYKSYLAALPEADNRREVEERLQELRECAAKKAEAPDPPVVPATEPSVQPSQAAPLERVRPVPVAPDLGSHEPKTLRAGPIAISAVGAALAIAGSVLYGEAYQKHREAERVCPCYPGTYAKWETLTKVSYVALGAGAVTLVGGISWWIFGAPKGTAGPSQAGLGIRGRF